VGYKVNYKQVESTFIDYDITIIDRVDIMVCCTLKYFIKSNTYFTKFNMRVIGNYYFLDNLDFDMLKAID